MADLGASPGGAGDDRDQNSHPRETGQPEDPTAHFIEHAAETAGTVTAGEDFASGPGAGR